MMALAFLFNTWIGRALMGFVLACALLAGFRWKILSDARQREALAAVQSQLAAAHADIGIARLQADQAQKRATDIESAAHAWTEKVNDLQRELAARDNAPAPVEQPAVNGQCPALAPPRPAVADADDIKRLRAIAR